MNERMIELYKQAQEFAYKNISEEYWNTDNFHAIVSGKFAELIVEECMEVAHPKLTDVGRWAAGMRLVQKRLEQHFGVEE